MEKLYIIRAKGYKWFGDKLVYLAYNKRTNRFNQMPHMNYKKEYLLLFTNKDLADTWCKDLNRAIFGYKDKGNLFNGMKRCQLKGYASNTVIGEVKDYEVVEYNNKNGYELIAQFPGVYMINPLQKTGIKRNMQVKKI